MPHSSYRASLSVSAGDADSTLRARGVIYATWGLIMLLILPLFILSSMSTELAPTEDQGVVFGVLNTPSNSTIDQSSKFAARGYSSTEFHLRMTREEIGSYLGLKLETVSRTLSHFQTQGLIAVQNKHLRILKIEELRELVSHHNCRDD